MGNQSSSPTMDSSRTRNGLIRIPVRHIRQGAYGQAPALPLGAVQLEQLVAPIALYPDRLVAQILAASTYPSQVADADHWRQGATLRLR